MNKLFCLTCREFILQNRINNLTKYLTAFFFFCTFSMSLINAQEEIKIFGIIFAIICIPLGLIGLSSFIFKNDLEDGSLEQMLTSFFPAEIVIAKFLSVLLSASLALVISAPLQALIFNLELYLFLKLFIVMLLLLILASGILILTAAIQSYFRANTNFLSVLTMPLLVPGIIISGLIMQGSQNLYLMLILLGMDLVLVPVALVLSSCLVKDIYNI